jgi:hypothetical protein
MPVQLQKIQTRRRLPMKAAKAAKAAKDNAPLPRARDSVVWKKILRENDDLFRALAEM